MNTEIQSSDASCVRTTGSLTPILFVDLDGTLVKTDVLNESLVLAVKQNPLRILSILFWLMQGRAVLKQRLARLVAPNVKLLPYRHDVLRFLEERKKAGQRIVLATATDRRWGQAVFEELGLFEALIATDGGENLKGVKKRQAMEAYCQAHGGSSWSYVGDSHADLAIWRKSTEIFAVSPSPSLYHHIEKIDVPKHYFGYGSFPWKAILRVLRPAWWVKGLLFFVPLIGIYHWIEPIMFWQAVLGYLAFCCCLSGGFVLNDLYDLESDRRHLSKRHRPFAAGDLSIVWGPWLAGGLLIFAGSLAYLSLGLRLVLLLGIVFSLLAVYWLWTKRSDVIPC